MLRIQIGKYLSIRKNDEVVKQFLVGAVVKKNSKNSSFHFDIITQYENLLDSYDYKEFDWNADIHPVLYLRLNNASAAKEVENELQKYCAINNEIKEEWKISDFNSVPFNEQKDETRFIHSYTTWSGFSNLCVVWKLDNEYLDLTCRLFQFYQYIYGLCQ